ncbi:MAG: hypothetical protein AB1805_13325 [Nitrospirota bacterium]
MRHKGKTMDEIEGRDRGKRKGVSIDERLKDNPILRARIESIIEIAENEDGSIEKADDAEQRAIEELRKLGSELLHAWAERQQQRKSDEQQQGETPGRPKAFWCGSRNDMSRNCTYKMAV